MWTWSCKKIDSRNSRSFHTSKSSNRELISTRWTLQSFRRKRQSQQKETSKNSEGLVRNKRWAQKKWFSAQFRIRVLNPTWIEHATFWSGVRRATIAPRIRAYGKFLAIQSLYKLSEIRRYTSSLSFLDISI